MSSKTQQQSDLMLPADPLREEFCRNELFDLLGNRRRRSILLYLYQTTSPVESSEIATRIAAWENETPPEQVPSSLYQSVYNSLYQTHLPRLEAAGFVEYDHAENLVYPMPRIAEVGPCIESVAPQATGRPTRRYWPLLSCLLVVVSVVSLGTVLSSKPLVISAMVLVFVGAFAGGRLTA